MSAERVRELEQALAELASHIDCARCEDDAQRVLCHGCIAALERAKVALQPCGGIDALCPPIRLEDAGDHPISTGAKLMRLCGDEDEMDERRNMTSEDWP